MPALVAVFLSLSAIITLNPVPQMAEIQGKGLFPLREDLPVVADASLAEEIPVLMAPLFEAMGFPLSTVSLAQFDTDNRALYVGVVGQNSAFENRAIKRSLSDITSFGDEAYVLRIWKQGILVAGAGRTGMIHGLYTLLQLLQEARTSEMEYHGAPALPFAEIRDYPDLSVRGAYVRGPLTQEQVQGFALLKCTMLIFESDDFYDLDATTAAAWREVFENARNAGIIPVPVAQFLQVPERLLIKAPTAVEGRSRMDRLQLSAKEWSELAKRSLIVTDQNPVRAGKGSELFQAQEDYEILGGPLQVPFGGPDASIWKLRRMADGAISEKDVTEVTYSYASPGSNALCPHAPEAETLFREVVQTLVAELNPAYIHCGFGDIGRLNQDLRCRDKRKSNVDTFKTSISLVQRVIADINPAVSLIFWADAVLPADPEQENDPASLHAAADAFPDTALVIPRFGAHACTLGGAMEATLPWLVARGARPVAAIAGEPVPCYAALNKLGNFREQRPGIIVLDAAPDAPATQTALAKAWTSSSVILPWPERFNEFFGVRLWEPDFEQMKEAVISHVERQLLAGATPAQIRESFSDFDNNPNPQRWSKRKGPGTVSSLLDVITGFVELEYDYARGKENTALRTLSSVVKRYGELDAAVEPERTDRILATIKQQSLFVPASILFKKPIVFYRPYQPPADNVPSEVPFQAHYEDTEGTVKATFDFLVPCGPLYRMDFETINASALTVSKSDNGLNFEAVEATTGLDTKTPRGPLFFSKGITARYLQLTMESAGEKAVLRDVRVFVLRAPAGVTCPQTDEMGPQVGMLFTDQGRLATAPTEIHVSRNSTELTLHITACDPIPHAMSAILTETDAPLWEEESVEVRVSPPNRPARRFLVNLLGNHHDAIAVTADTQNWDPGWDADWRVQVNSDKTGWSAIIHLPFSIVGGTPKPGDTWQINFLRHRNNIEEETSTWAAETSGYGTLTFE